MIEFKELICGTCGVHHWIPTAMYEAKRSEGGFWHCPNGHAPKLCLAKLCHRLGGDRRRVDVAFAFAGVDEAVYKLSEVDRVVRIVHDRAPFLMRTRRLRPAGACLTWSWCLGTRGGTSLRLA